MAPGLWNQKTSVKVRQLVSGESHICALLDNSTVKCWGHGQYGQLGSGNTNRLGDGVGEMGDKLTPINLGTGRTAVQIAAGHFHSCALLDNSSVKCWGSNANGRLGQGHTDTLGDGASEMGDNLPAIDLGSGRTAVQIGAGWGHTCALLDNSTVKCWGSNANGRLGQGHLNDLGDGAGEMGDNLSTINLGSGRSAVQIAVGANHTCALLDNSSVKCWGYNFYAQLGQGHTNALGDAAGEMGDSLPAVSLGTGRSAIRIAAGYNNTCAVLDNSTLKCWGGNIYGQLGQGNTNALGDGAGEMGDSLPTINLGTGRSAMQISVGADHVCAVLDNSQAKCWGRNTYGTLGQGHTNNLGDSASEMGDNLPAIELGSGRSAKQIVSAGAGHVCVLLDNSSVKCWGYNFAGQLGQGHTNNLGDGAGEMGDNLPFVNLGLSSSRLAKILDTPKSKLMQITAGDYTCAILDNSTVKCWGRNNYGQLGQGHTDNLGDGAGETGDSLPPVNLGTGRTALQISGGVNHVCVLLDDSSVKCWGRNNSGQLGQGHMNNLGDGAGEMGDDLPAINLGTGRKALQVAVGSSHACALLDNSSVKCWGAGSSGQLGYGNANSIGDGAGEMGDSLPAINLGTGRRAVHIAAGSHHTCAILDNNNVKCWGYNQFGQLGQGSTSNLGDGANEMGDNLPVINLGTGRRAVQIAGGQYHTCALLDNASVKCWGYNISGQLGLGNTSSMGDGAGEMGDNLPALELGAGRGAIQIVIGWQNHSCVLLDNSMVKCWGINSSGQLGQGSTNQLGDGAGEMGDSLPAINLGTGHKAVRIAAGYNHSCALLDNGTLKCWGENFYGQFGLGNNTSLGNEAGEMGDSLPIVNLGTSK